MSFSTPVAFLIFNRPGVTRRVLHAIRQVRPTTLLVVCDGPRHDRPGEQIAVMQTRAVIDEVDWPCNVMTEYSDVNLGCKRRVSSGLDWIFSNVDDAIVLEDDCVPDPSFFHFCRDMLEHYRDDERVFSISGSNFQGGRTRTANGFYFSKYFHCWGWATWGSAWRCIDLEMTRWKQFVDSGGLHKIADTPSEEKYWKRILDSQSRGEIDSWAYSCLASSWLNHKVNIIPNLNLVHNIGFGSQATHTKNVPTWIPKFADRLTQWSPPDLLARNKAADLFTFKTVYARPHKLRRWANKIRKQWNRISNRVAA